MRYNYGKIFEKSQVRTLRDMMNGGNIIPAGAVGVVRERYGGLTIEFRHKCAFCHYGDRVFITHVDPKDVELTNIDMSY